MLLISLDKHSVRIILEDTRRFSSVNLCFLAVNMEMLISSSNFPTVLIKLQHDPEVGLQLPKLMDWHEGVNVMRFNFRWYTHYSLSLFLLHSYCTITYEYRNYVNLQCVQYFK